MLNFLLFLVIGGVAGWAATRLFKTDKQTSVVAYVFIGVIGAVVGKFILGFVGFVAVEEGVIVDFIVAFIGAASLVGLSKLIAGKLLN